jgi:hypothetical protein
VYTTYQDSRFGVGVMEKKVWLLLAVLFMCVGSVHAELHDRGCGLLYDDVLDITWLQDANYALTKQHDPDGQMTWQQANDWAANLQYYDQCRGVWYTDWRLPDEKNIDGTGPEKGRVRTSELGHMFYTNLANSFLSWPAKDYHVNANGKTWIKNMQKTGEYWENGACSSNYGWAFHNLWGNQACARNTKQLFAWAVRDGDVPSVLYRENFDNSALGWTPDGCDSLWNVVQAGGYHGKVYQGDLYPASGCKDSYSDYRPDPYGNHIIETDVYIYRELSGGTHGLALRAVDDYTRYIFGLHAGSKYPNGTEINPPMFQFMKRVDDVNEVYISEEYPVKTNRWYRLGVSFRGNSISCYVDGKLVASFTDPDPLRGERFAVKAHGSGTRFDNVIIRPLDGPVEKPEEYGLLESFEDGLADGWVPDGCADEWSVRFHDPVHNNVYSGDLSSCMDSFYIKDYKIKDYLLETELLVFRENKGGWHGLIGRASDQNNGYILAMSTDTADPKKIYLYKMVEGKATMLYYGPYPFIQNKWYRLGLQFRGDTVAAYVDGMKLWEGKDLSGPIYGNRIGVKAHGSGVNFDNIRLTALPEVEGES